MRTGSRGSVLTWILLAGLALLLAPSVAGAQVACGNTAPPCTGGVCPELFDGGGTSAGTPTCQQPKGEKCACILMKADAACTIVAGRCKGKCEPLYRSAADAGDRKSVV